MTTKRTRIVCISDTHNQTPKLPVGDILIHAGDLTNQGSFSELQRTIDWIKQSDFQVKIIVCGNHDVTCDAPFYHQHGAQFHNKKIEDPERCIDLFHSDSSITYLAHETKEVRIVHKDGAISKLNVFGSPLSPAHGFWAFGYLPDAASHIWDQIPLEADIVVTHTPPKSHRDACGNRGSAGCERLREALWRVRPRLAVCGHIHEAYGIEAVTWDLSSSNPKFKEQSVRSWEDPEPGSKKQFAVDLSLRSTLPALQNDGSNGTVGLTTRSSRPPMLRGAGVNGNSDSISPSASDDEAIAGREGRAETCIVNASFMGSNWPHKGGKRFHKPIVVDLDLPTVDESSGENILEPEGGKR